MAIKNETRQVGPLTLRAAIVPDSINVEARTVDVLWGTETPVRRGGYYTEPFDEVLSMDPANVRMGRLNSGKAPVLDSHNTYGGVDGVRGVVSKAAVNGKTGTATLRFAKAEHDAAAERMFGKIRDGIVANLSVGYRVHKFEKQPKADPTNPREIPVMRAVDWEPYEISPVAIGADANAGFRSGDQQPLNECVFLSRNMETDPMTPEQLAEQKRQEDLAIAQRAEAARAEQARRENEIKVAERTRVEGIRHACRKLPDAEARAAKLIADGTSLVDARAALWDEIAERSMQTETGNQNHVGSGISVGMEAKEKFLRGAEASLLARAGILVGLAAASKDSKILGVRRALQGIDPLNDGGEIRNFGFVEIARELLEMGGKKTRGMSKNEILDAAFKPNFSRASGESTISDFAVLLENVMYKSLLGAYATVADTWRSFCGTDTVPDFRPSNRYRTGAFGVLDALGEGGEFKNKAIPDGLKFAISTETVGNMIAVSRQALINDDMGALLETTQKFGRMAGLSIEVAVYALIAQNSGLGPNITLGGVTAPFFDNTAWKNISTSSALSMAALEADRVKMSQQKDISNNEYLSLRPSTLLVPVGLGGLARQINRSEYDPTAGSALMAPNISKALFSNIVDTPRISGTQRYLFTDPGEAAAFKVVFLNDLQAPFMDQRIGWRSDGIEMKVRLDFKAQAFDPKGALYNAGV